MRVLQVEDSFNIYLDFIIIFDRDFDLQSWAKPLKHFAFWRKFRVEIPSPSIAMFDADGNVIDKLTSMSS